ncbi:TetR/AcrR family transcriptional regulator [Actinomadura spongiicola]|uniref:TetR/AcrR family transcriptional regulator n=1 Tax=Actinomadura spongiicola TaxID=2303421 RepID=A0A372GIE1_9ACTN|nr:TetR/AcrR family transcriptional regulator [Actinomadura spongiicola]RFS85154.1 TetR/AcrR family transcriptional regulator [Actinomadura spongiicola]
MSKRREQLLDAAIAVLGERGTRELTHRAVDAAAGLPVGSASNHFRTRDALLSAVVERFAARERAHWDDVAARIAPSTPRELAHALTVLAREATGPHRTATMARYAILVEAGLHPSLRARLTETGARVNAWFTNWLRVAGSTDPERDAPIIMNHWTGVVLHQLADPDPAFDPFGQFSALVVSAVGPRARQPSSLAGS